MIYDKKLNQLKESYKKLNETQTIINELNDVVKYVEKAGNLQNFVDYFDGKSIKIINDMINKASFDQTQRDHDLNFVSPEEKHLLNVLSAIRNIATNKAKEEAPVPKELLVQYQIVKDRADSADEEFKKRKKELLHGKFNSSREKMDAQKKLLSDLRNNPDIKEKTELLNKIEDIKTNHVNDSYIDSSTLLKPETPYQERYVKELVRLFGEMTGEIEKDNIKTAKDDDYYVRKPGEEEDEEAWDKKIRKDQEDGEAYDKAMGY